MDQSDNTTKSSEISNTPNKEDIGNEKVLFLVNRDTGLAPYSYEFIDNSQDPQLLSGFVGAMTGFMGEVTGTEQSEWKTVYGLNSTLIVEGGKWIVGVLSMAHETNEARSKLRRIIREFENSFEMIKDADCIPGSAFNDFHQIVRKIFLDDRLTEQTIILKIKDKSDLFEGNELPNELFHARKFISNIKPGISIGEAAAISNISIPQAIELVSKGIWKKSIYVSYMPSNKEILAPSPGALQYIYDQQNPLKLSPHTLLIIGALNGETPLFEVVKSIGPPNESYILLELSYLVNQGYLQRITFEKRLLLVNRCILQRFLKICKENLGSKRTGEIVNSCIQKEIHSNPWFARIRLLKEMEISCSINSDMSSNELEHLTKAIDFIIQTITGELSRVEVKRDIDFKLKNAQQKCFDYWAPYLVGNLI